jgi:mannose-1-phosphate guanylyltransferase
MAGGNGTRLWPESTPEKPKPFLTFQGDTPLIRATYDRLFGLVDPSRIIIVAGKSMLPLVQQTFSDIRIENVLLEPVSRNTAPCIGLTAISLLRNDPDATMIVLPADHLIEPVRLFRDTLRFAAELVEESPEQLVLLGVRPNFPSTAFGYIECGEKWDPSTARKWANLTSVRQVLRFHEKPDILTVENFAASGNFRWNTGIFVWKAGRILDLICKYQPKMGAHLQKIAEYISEANFPEILEKEFHAIDRFSIDYAVLEHEGRSGNIRCIDAPFQWNDIGSWSALREINRDKIDEYGNLQSCCKMMTIDSSNNIVRCDDERQVIALVGVENLIVIQTVNGTLIANKNDESKIREIVARLHENGDI